MIYVKYLNEILDTAILNEENKAIATIERSIFLKNSSKSVNNFKK